ncbi:MAG: hypothetical protein GY751_16200 [Bacteroidetes bacterium]|nr:hypothetical protein [Bacteroidota bacterium]
MKNYIVILTLFASITANTAFAARQEHQTQEDRLENRLEFLSIVLDLTEDQVVDIRSLQQSHISTVKNIRTEYEPVMNELKEALKTIRLQSEGNIEASRQAAKEVREGYKPQLEPMKQAIKTERTAFNEVLAQMFSTEQQEKYQALKAFKEDKRAMEKRHTKRH